nr:MAG TPA: hypothetical protein [Caudoviricetes sp.]DAS44022.1 MAG TPA: hypothetical protein [Caudoviricetes sp.]
MPKPFKLFYSHSPLGIGEVVGIGNVHIVTQGGVSDTKPIPSLVYFRIT